MKTKTTNTTKTGKREPKEIPVTYVTIKGKTYRRSSKEAIRAAIEAYPLPHKYLP